MKAAYEDAIFWGRGSIDAILAGGSPKLRELTAERSNFFNQGDRSVEEDGLLGAIEAILKMIPDERRKAAVSAAISALLDFTSPRGGDGNDERGAASMTRDDFDLVADDGDGATIEEEQGHEDHP